MLCYVVLSCAMFCYAVLCCAMLCYTDNIIIKTVIKLQLVLVNVKYFLMIDNRVEDNTCNHLRRRQVTIKNRLSLSVNDFPIKAEEPTIYVLV